MIVVYIADRKLYWLLPTAVNSLLRNNPHIKAVYLFLEDDEVASLQHLKIKIFNLNNYKLLKINKNCSSKFPYTAMTRLFLPSMIEEDKVIYLDVDTIVDGRLREMWMLDIADCYVAARPETAEYYNSGVLLMNLQYMREHNSEERIRQLLQSRHFEYPDQDVMNIVFKNHIKTLPKKFNVFESAETAYQQEIAVRHFAGIYKPWWSNSNAQDVAFWRKYYCNSLM